MRLFRFLFLILFCFPIFLCAQIDDPSAVFRELRTLEGTWFMPTDRGDRLEVWSIGDDSTLIGQGFRIREDTRDTVTLETMRIELRDTSIFYVVTVRGQNQNQPVIFRLTEADFEGYLFENPQHDNPKKIRYLLLGNRELQVLTEGKRGNRTVNEEFVFEREFTPAGIEFRLKAGINASLPRATGNLLLNSDNNYQPEYTLKPGWDLGAQFIFRGRGGFVNFNVDLGLSGRYFGSQSTDTVLGNIYRDVTYQTVWANLSLTPEIRFKRDGRLSVLAGPYIAQLIRNKTKGDQLPSQDSGNYNSNDDFKKLDLGIVVGLQYRVDFFKKDFGGILGLRASAGLRNLDNLYTKDRDNDPFFNGQVKLSNISLYYSVNLSKL